MSESSEGVIGNTSKWRQALERVNPFIRRSKSVTSPITLPVAITPEPESAVSTIPTEESKPEIAVEESVIHPVGEISPTFAVEITEDKDLIQAKQEAEITIEQKERLRPANSISFHATTLEDVPNIQAHGLYSFLGHDILGRDLIYSIYFEKEYEGPVSFRPKARGGNKNTFALTIWKASPYIKKFVGEEAYHWGSGRPGQFKATETVEDQKDLPTSYVDSALGGPVHPSTKFAKIPPTEFLGAIKIDQQLKDNLIVAQLKFIYNLDSADNIEAQLRQGVEGTSILSEGYAIDQLVHDLMGNIEQTILSSGYGKSFRGAWESLTQGKHDVRGIGRVLEEIMKKQAMVNEPISKRFLQIWEDRIKTAVEQQGLTKQVDERLKYQKRWASYERQSYVDYYDIDIWHDSLQDVTRVAKGLGVR